jgi:hypothetical protein
LFPPTPGEYLLKYALEWIHFEPYIELTQQDIQ